MQCLSFWGSGAKWSGEKKRGFGGARPWLLVLLVQEGLGKETVNENRSRQRLLEYCSPSPIKRPRGPNKPQRTIRRLDPPMRSLGSRYLDQLLIAGFDWLCGLVASAHRKPTEDGRLLDHSDTHIRDIVDVKTTLRVSHTTQPGRVEDQIQQEAHLPYMNPGWTTIPFARL